jgi:apolipoprotein D and lipocalin family protein
MKRIAAVGVAVVMVGMVMRGVGFSASLPPVQTVPRVDLERYLGVWYEIARYPTSFQKGCLDSSATYSRRADGKIQVVNRCRDAEDGRIREAKGKAWVVDKKSNAKLKVSFFWPFRGDYWIIDLGREYEYAVVGTPNRKYLWVLSREPVMSDELYEQIVTRAEQQGFKRSKLVREQGGYSNPGTK